MPSEDTEGGNAMCEVPGHPGQGRLTVAECERYVRRIERVGGVGQWLILVKIDHRRQAVR